MTRRFPPGAVGLPSSQSQYRAVLELVATTSGPLIWDTFRNQCQEYIRKPDSGEQYGEPWIRRLTSDMASSGLVHKQTQTLRPRRGGPTDTETKWVIAEQAENSSAVEQKEVVTLWPTGHDWLDGTISFETFLWRSLKRGWVINANAPEKIEALERVLYVVVHAGEPCTKSEIETRLETNHDYSFNDLGIRGYPQLLELMGTVVQTDHAYEATSAAESYLSKFRQADLFRKFESWLRKEGTTGSLPTEATKRDLMKYYMYRESEGWGKQTRWLKSFWHEYLDDRAQSGDTSRPELKRSQQYLNAEERRKKLREQIKNKFDFGSSEVSGLSTETLERIASVDSNQEAHRIRVASGSGISRADLETLHDETRPSYTFPEDFSLYDWQSEAASAWRSSSGGRSDTGIAQVVTGAGKTVMALDIIRNWITTTDDGVITILVPTRVLMKQWLTELLTKLNVRPEDVGWAGDGQRDAFTNDRRIVVSIINTAVLDDFLQSELAAVDEPPHLLVADECHRYTGDTFSDVFEYHRTAELGLSATPTSNAGFGTDDEDELTPDDKLLLDELGDIYYSLTYDEALDRELISPFEVNYVGFNLTDREQNMYDQYTRKLSNAIGDIESRYGHRLSQLHGSYAQKLQVLKNESDAPTPAISDYFEFTQDRRELIADAVARQAITLELLQRSINQDKQTVVFQERIEQLEQLIAPFERRDRNPRTGELTGTGETRQELYETYPELHDVDLAIEDLFDDPNFWPVMYHSGHSRDRWNDFAMEWFRDEGFANVMLSVKALIEGVDVPSADVGIIRVSNSSIRQRIQTFGRVLRTGDDPSKQSQLYVLYARDTVDERLFKEYDWDEQLSGAEVNHLYWEPEDGVLDGNLREIDEPLPSGGDEYEIEVPDAAELQRGDRYEGPQRGFEFSVNSDANPIIKRTDTTEDITNPELVDVAQYVYELKGGGTVIINETNHMLTMLEDGPIFLGTFDPNDIESTERKGLTGDAPDSLDFF